MARDVSGGRHPLEWRLASAEAYLCYNGHLPAAHFPLYVSVCAEGDNAPQVMKLGKVG